MWGNWRQDVQGFASVRENSVPKYFHNGPPAFHFLFLFLNFLPLLSASVDFPHSLAPKSLNKSWSQSRRNGTQWLRRARVNWKWTQSWSLRSIHMTEHACHPQTCGRAVEASGDDYPQRCPHTSADLQESCYIQGWTDTAVAASRIIFFLKMRKLPSCAITCLKALGRKVSDDFLLYIDSSVPSTLQLGHSCCKLIMYSDRASRVMGRIEEHRTDHAHRAV